MPDLVWLVLWLAQALPPVRTPVTVNASVDSAQCAACHPKIAATYAKTGMARAFYRPANLGTTRYYHQPSDTWYAIEQRGDLYYHRRWRIGFDGRETEIQESKIDYVMGSGNHVKTFLTKTERGALMELPLAWYAEGGGTWAMNPGHDATFSLTPRAVAYECMFCHNGYPQIPKGHEEQGREPLYTGKIPEGIDCQRCHGPGGAHVKAAQTPGAAKAAIRAAIVNPARLSKDRQMEVCYQCHLETTSLQLPHSLLKYGRNPFSYKPGDPLGDFMLFFDHAKGSKYDDDFEIAHSAYRLRRSKCFLESKGAMTCATCHDPHDIPRGAEATAHYNGVCAQCHAALPAQHTPGSDCVSCHMPKRRTVDVVRAVMTDHYIQGKLPPEDLTAARAERHAEPDYRGEVVPYYPTADPLYRAVAQVAHRSNLRQGVPALATEISRQKPARAEFYVALGEALVSSSDPKAAIPILEQATLKNPASPVAMLDLADALTQAGESARAIGVLNRAVKMTPTEPLLWYQLGVARSTSGDYAAAIAAYEKALALDPGFQDAWNLLGEARAASGDMAGAETAFRTALRIHPDLYEAQGNLAHLLVSSKRLPEAAYYFERAVRGKPDDSDIRENYGVTLSGLGKPDEALTQFLEAVRIKPNFGLAHLNVAAILAQKGDLTEARRHLDLAARDEDPGVRQRALQQLR